MRITIFITIFSFTLFFQNCAPYHDNKGLVNTDTSLSIDTLPLFEQTLKPALQDCSQCHASHQQPMFAVSDSALSQQRLIEYSLVNFNDPANSRIVKKIRGGHQSFSSSVADNLETQITAWKTLLDEKSINGDGSTGVDNTPTLQPSFNSIHKLILIPKCVGCHSPNGRRSSEDYTDYYSTINTGKVTPGDVNDSAMYIECKNTKMPQNAPKLSDEELAAIRVWINNGALNN